MYNEAPKGPSNHYISGMARYEEFLLLKIHLYIRHCIIARRIQKMNATFLSFDNFYISSRPNFPHGQPIKGNSVCIAWISWCKTTCTLIGVFSICMFKACIFPALFCFPRWHLFISVVLFTLYGLRFDVQRIIYQTVFDVELYKV